MPPNTPLGDKFREAAGYAENHTALDAMDRAGVPDDARYWFLMAFLWGRWSFENDEHRVIAMLFSACMADTGDLK